MNRSSVLGIAGLVLAACGRGSEQASVDTTLVFVATPSSTSVRSYPGRSPFADTLTAALNAYRANRITAESAATVVVRYMISTGKNVDGVLDPPLRDAVAHELKKRARS